MGALPQALAAEGHEVRLLLPGLPAIADAVLNQRPVCSLGAMFGAGRVELRSGRMPFSDLPVYVIDAPFLYRRPGGPYQAADGSEWPDNPQRFGLLGWVAAHLAAGELDPAWKPDILHAHDWHAAMACAYLEANPAVDVASVFTIHNLAFQGLFAAGDFHLLGLPSRLMHATGLEFHHQLSFMKAGLKFADHVTTVSPTYAREIATPEHGFGLHGVIQGRVGSVSGILNGVDGEVWNPADDPVLPQRYSAEPARRQGRSASRCCSARWVWPKAPTRCCSRSSAGSVRKRASTCCSMRCRRSCRATPSWCCSAAVSPGWKRRSGRLPQRWPRQVAVHIGYDERAAHSIIAGADAVLVPSRFEPCGLTQLYALRYGSVPIVRRVGGLADTVVDADEAALR